MVAVIYKEALSYRYLACTTQCQPRDLGITYIHYYTTNCPTSSTSNFHLIKFKKLILYPLQVLSTTSQFSTTFVCAFDHALPYMRGIKNTTNIPHHQNIDEKAHCCVVFVRP
jgi:hypothetical protein